MKKKMYLSVLFLTKQLFVISVLFAQPKDNRFQRTIALLDLTSKNKETSSAEMISAKYILSTSGIPFISTTNLTTACKYGVILASSRFDIKTFSGAERDSLIEYVDSGGILIATSVKDSYFYPLFGISQINSSNKHHFISFNMSLNDPSFKYLNDPMEQSISLGDTASVTTINTYNYNTSTATPLAFYDDKTTAITKQSYGKGMSYALGFSFKALILTNQINRDIQANRIGSNGFEPTSDAVMLFVKAIYEAHIKNAVTIHTSPFDTYSTLVVTHDIDASSAYDTMHYYSEYEYSIGLRASYFFTTHYFDDGLMSDYYNASNIEKIKEVIKHQHIAGSHSVGHFPDFANSNVFPMGLLGNTNINYHPYNSGKGATVGGSVLGETEVSKKLLEEDLSISIKSFRAGHLCFNEKLINSLDTLGYSNNSTFCAADVLTNFPYQQPKDQSVASPLSHIWEFPITISDVFHGDPITAKNYKKKVDIWLDVIRRNTLNYAPSVLLIHPTRLYKLNAEQDLIKSLSPTIYTTNLDWFADYWRKRASVYFSSKLSNDSLILIVPSAQLPLDTALSFIIHNGKYLKNITASDELGNMIPIKLKIFNTNDMILYFREYKPLTLIKSYSTAQMSIIYFPNPCNDYCNFEFNLAHSSKIRLDISDILGRPFLTLYQGILGEGLHRIPFQTTDLLSGIYFYTFTVDGVSVSKKLMIIKN